MVELRAHSAERAGLESAAGSGMVSRQTSSVSRRKRGRRSRSAPRLLDTNKPKKQNKYLDTATSSISSLPSRIQLTMLNSGLIPIADEDKAIRAIPRKPIEKGNFVKYCEQHRKYPILFKVEFQHAGRVEAHPTRHGTKSCNEIKNQNHKIVPYDYNRVVLDPQRDPDSPDGTVGTVSDYINASYVDSLLKPNAYIVTQGPNERTVNDLWRMVWKERSPSIVMLTKTFDFIKVMCVQYWPSQPDKEELYGTIRVTVLKEEQLANFVIRSIRLRQGSEERSLLQLHYTEWPCHSCPFSNAILEFRRRIRICLNNRVPDLDGPTIVHCSDGAGRSGVFLAIDANIELAEEDGLFDIYGYLKKIRQARRGLIETVDQYRFVYDTLEEYVCCGYSSFPVSELSQRLKEKAVRLSGDKQNDYQREFSQICRQVPKFTIGDCAGGHRADNRHKNRDVMIVPPDNFRPYLTSFQGNAATDYINAVFVDGYNRSKEYIVTEWPLRATPSDFWSLAYDFSCNSIVVLTNPGDTAGYSHPREYIVTEWVLPPSVADLWSLVYDYDAAAVVVLCNPDASPNFPPFWPENTRSKKYGTVFTVEHISHQHYQNIKSWIFRINKKIVSLTELMAGVKADSKTCQLFQLTCWPVGYKVPTSTNALVELMNMVERWRQRSGYGPVIVVSPDGQCRAGVYCAANACIEQVVQHSEVDVFQAVKTVRRHRPQLISNMAASMPCLQPQQPAPFFKAQAVVNGEFKEISLDDYKGKYLVLFFYPLEFTFVCPTEIIAFSEAAKKFRDINCEVLACSTDFHFSHLAWINTPRKMGGLGEMDIPLLADKNMAISRAYGVLKEDEGVPFRGLFIIDGSSTLRQLIINDLPVGRSVDEVLRLAQAYQFTDEHGEMEYKYCYDLVLHYVLHYLNKDHPAH